jgi:hypothetical protein
MVAGRQISCEAVSDKTFAGVRTGTGSSFLKQADAEQGGCQFSL